MIYYVSFSRPGDIAQLVERLNGIEKVRGSTPLISTSSKDRSERSFLFYPDDVSSASRPCGEAPFDAASKCFVFVEGHFKPHGRFARNTKTRDFGKSPSAIGSAESSPGSKLRFTRRRLHVPTLRVTPKSRDTKIAQKVTKELLAGNGPLALRQQTQAVPRSLGAKSISCPFVRLSCSARSAREA